MTSSSSSSSGAASRVTGLVSGFDTSSIVESLMTIEKKPFAKLEVKKQTEELKLKAYQAVNTYLLKFRTSMSTLSASKLWNSKTAASSNDKSLGATASQYAVQGTYSFKVAQLATAAQSMSKGFASKTAPLADIKSSTGDTVNEKLGSISLNSAKTRVDNSAKLEELNGGKGIYRGSVRITDASNNTSIIDLSSCATMDDVVSALNNSDKAQITASIKDGALHIVDNSRGTGDLRIQNVGTGTTASDLGIAGTVAHATNGITALQGRNVYTIGNDTSLSKLNDGLGVEEGRFTLTVSGNGGNATLTFDTEGCATVGDLTKRINEQIAAKQKAGGTDPNGNGNYSDLLKDLTFGLSENKLAFGLSGVQQGFSYEFKEIATAAQGQATPATQLGLANGPHTVTAASPSVAFDRVIGDVNSPMLKTLAGLDSTSKTKFGDPAKVDVPFDANTKLSSMRNGEGMLWNNPLQIRLTEGGSLLGDLGATGKIFTDILDPTELGNIIDDPNATVGQYVDLLNKSIAAYAADPSKNAAGLTGMNFKVEDGAVTIYGAQSGYKVEILGSAESTLGLARFNMDGYAQTAMDGYTDKDGNADLIKYLYNLGDSHAKLTANNTDITSSTTMKDLVGFHGIDKNAEDGDGNKLYYTAGEFDQGLYDAAVTQKLQDLFGAEKGIDITAHQKFTVTNGDGTVGEMSVPINVALKISDIDALDKNGNVIGKLNENSDAETFIRSVNAAVQNQMNAEAATAIQSFITDPTNGGATTLTADQKTELVAQAQAFLDSGAKISAPQMKVHTFADSLQWSNLDFSRDWQMGGEVLTGLHLDKTIDNRDFRLGQTPTAQTISDGNRPKVIGAYSPIPADLDTKLSDLNLGMGLILGGDEADVLNFNFGKNADNEAVGISINMQELRDKVVAAGGDEITFGAYADVVNNLVQEKLTAYNDANGTDYQMTIGGNVNADGSVNLKISGIDGMEKIDNVANSDRFSITGTALATNVYNAGFSDFGYIDSPDPAKNYNMSSIVAGEIISGDDSDLANLEGLGVIQFSLGNNGTLYTLDTKGLNENSTLNDLLNHLNDQLADLAGKATDPSVQSALKNLSFRVSDAGTGIALDNNSSQSVTFHDTKDRNGNSDPNRLGQTLGLVGTDNSDVKVESFSRYNAGSLGRNYISRATSLDDFLGKGNTPGVITLTNAAGDNKNIDLTNAKTVGDVIDAINALSGNQNFGIFAGINSAGNGINVFEGYLFQPDDGKSYTGNIGIKDADNGTTAKKLGIAGTGTLDPKTNLSVFEGSLGLKIDVMSSDSLESIMYRLAASGDYKCAVINDGSATNPYRLTIASATTGEASDFVIDSNLAELFGFNQSTRGRDAKVLYGDPNSAASPIMLSSSTNTNSTAVLGLTLDLKAASADWTTITVAEDKEGIKEEIKNMVQAYNDLAGMVTYLDAYDEETGEPGILFGDTSVRGLMDEINEYFYQIFNPENATLGSLDAKGKQQTWTWMDLGISLTSKNTNTDGSGSWYTTMDLDLDKLDEMFASNWDVVSTMLSNSRNASNINGSQNNKPVANFNGKLAEGFSANGAINGDATKGGWGAANGVMAGDTIANGANQYSVFFQQPTTMTRLSLYHYSSDTALKDFKIEYMDKNGDWQTFRDITGNRSDTNHLGTAMPITMQALRITANSTNATDDTFRLLDVQVYEEIGLAGSLNQLTQKLGDSQLGFLAERTEAVQSNITDYETQMSKLQTKLDAKEESLWRRFTAMETALGKMQNQGSYFSSMMSGMNSKK